MDRGPRTAITGAVSQSALDFVEGGGTQKIRALSIGLWLMD